MARTKNQVKQEALEVAGANPVHGVHVGTWNGRPGESFIVALSGSKMGERIIVHRWTDTNEVTVRRVKGDGRTPRFVQFTRVSLGTDPDLDDLADAIADAVADSVAS